MCSAIKDSMRYGKRTTAAIRLSMIKQLGPHHYGSVPVRCSLVLLVCLGSQVGHKLEDIGKLVDLDPVMHSKSSRVLHAPARSFKDLNTCQAKR